MPQVRYIPLGQGYEPQPGERLIQLVNTGDVPLYIGIRNGEYMLAAAGGDPQVIYILTQEQYVRLEQQVQTQPTYRSWVKSGLLQYTEVTTPPAAADASDAAPTTPPPPAAPDEREVEAPMIEVIDPQ